MPLSHNQRRLKILWPFCILVILACKTPLLSPEQEWWTQALRILGLILVSLGVWVRLWALGVILKKRELASSGPYAFVRHPLYLGTLLLWWGFFFASSWLFGCLASLPFALVYYLFYKPQITHEETVLIKLFGQDYKDYQDAVPAFWPRFRLLKSQQPGFSFKRMLKNKAWQLLLGIFIILALMDFSSGVLWPSFEKKHRFLKTLEKHYLQGKPFTTAP